MICTHLKQIHVACQTSGFEIGQTDLIRMVCSECGEQEVCPANSVTMESDQTPAIGNQTSQAKLGTGASIAKPDSASR